MAYIKRLGDSSAVPVIKNGGSSKTIVANVSLKDQLNSIGGSDSKIIYRQTLANSDGILYISYGDIVNTNNSANRRGDGLFSQKNSDLMNKKLLGQKIGGLNSVPNTNGFFVDTTGFTVHEVSNWNAASQYIVENDGNHVYNINNSNDGWRLPRSGYISHSAAYGNHTMQTCVNNSTLVFNFLNDLNTNTYGPDNNGSEWITQGPTFIGNNNVIEMNYYGDFSWHMHCSSDSYLSWCKTMGSNNIYIFNFHKSCNFSYGSGTRVCIIIHNNSYINRYYGAMIGFKYSVIATDKVSNIGRTIATGNNIAIFNELDSDVNKFKEMSSGYVYDRNLHKGPLDGSNYAHVNGNGLISIRIYE